MVKFLRRTWNRYAKLGKGRKKKQIWRRPTGRDNKMREKRRGYPAVVSVGYGKKKQEKILVIKTKREIENTTSGQKIIIGKIGKKKGIELLKLAKEKKLIIVNKVVEKKLNKPVEKNESK